MIAVLRTLIEGVKQEKRKALDELRRRLESRGYDISHNPDPNFKSYRLGAEVCVFLSEQNGEIARVEVSEIEHITRQVAGQFGFTPIGVELVYGNNNSALAYCGFLK